MVEKTCGLTKCTMPHGFMAQWPNNEAKVCTGVNEDGVFPATSEFTDELSKQGEVTVRPEWDKHRFAQIKLEVGGTIE